MRRRRGVADLDAPRSELGHLAHAAADQRRCGRTPSSSAAATAAAALAAARRHPGRRERCVSSLAVVDLIPVAGRRLSVWKPAAGQWRR